MVVLLPDIDSHITSTAMYNQSTHDYNTTQMSMDTGPLDVFIETGGIKCNISYPDCELTRNLWIWTAPLILLLGTVGNVLIIMVMSRKPLRRTAFGLYLIAMAIMDLIFIWVGLTRHFIKNYYDIDIRLVHQSICWLQRFILYGSSNSSVWLLTAVTVERTVSIYSPIRYARINTLKKTKIFIAIIIAIQFLWNGHIFFTRGVARYEKNGVMIENRCGFVGEHAIWYYEHSVQTYLAAIDYSILPFIAMLSMNIAIFINLRKRDRRYKNCATIHNTNGTIKQVKTNKVSNKTLMLLPVTIFFLVTTLPHLILTGLEESRETKNEERAALELADYFVSMLTYSNHSVNFFLYCLTGKMFRAKCRSLLKQCCASKDRDSFENSYSRSPTTRLKSVHPQKSTSLMPNIKLDSLEPPKRVRH